MDRLVLLARDLDSATTFERASDVTLAAVLDLAEAALAGSEYAKSGRLLRAMVHLRPDDGYLRLVALEASARKSGCRVGQEAHLPSASAWRWVRSHRVPVALDVDLEIVQTLDSDVLGPPKSGSDTINLHASRLKLAGRDVTHLLAIPLRLCAGRIEGMIAVEAACPQARATSFAWNACAAELEKLAAIAAPYLGGLPITQVETTPPDLHLPVIGASMQRVVQMLRIFARQEETILLGGPTGVGKSRLAVWCHAQSSRRGQPFEAVDLLTVPEELQMAELFGWRRGAFTGADKSTPGAIARAERGTLFIDEIDKLSLKAQAGLLRVLEERQYRPLGEGEGEKKANVRFLVGTNADLMELTQKGLFREDLYYRINVLPVRIARLADRVDEVIPWARFMLKRRHETTGATDAAELMDEAARILQAQDWPGNLRQLDNIVRRAYALALVDAEGAAGPVSIGVSEIERALAYEAKPSHSPAWELFERAAEAFVVEAERRIDRGERLDMDLTDGMKGLVIDTAKRRIGGDEREALRRSFVLFDKEATVKDRNHTTVYRREHDKLELLRRALDPGERKR